MLKISKLDKQILDSLKSADPQTVAAKLGIPRRRVYDVKYQLRRKVQNAREFLQVANSTYKELLGKRINTPGIMPADDEEPLEIEKHSREESLCQSKKNR